MQIEGSFSAVVVEAFPTNTLGYFDHGTATLQFTIAGQTFKPFTRSGAVTVIRRKPTEKNKIRIVVSDASGDLQWQLWFRMDPYRTLFTTGTHPIGYWEVWTDVFQGDPRSPKSQRRSLENKGTLELMQTSTNIGGTISGKFEINTSPFAVEKKQPRKQVVP
jgi:hypothetical protein